MNKIKVISPYITKLNNKDKEKSHKYNKTLTEVACTMASESTAIYTGDAIDKINLVFNKTINNIH